MVAHRQRRADKREALAGRRTQKALIRFHRTQQGAVEAAICALSLIHAWLPPTINLQIPDGACDLDYIPGTGRAARTEYVVSNSFGFGGINASLVFRRAD